MVRAFPLIILVSLALGSVFASRATLALRTTGPSAEEAAVPLPALPPAFALGQHTTVADLYWLNMIAYVGHPAHIASDWPQLPRLLDRVLATDPDFEYPYQAGGLLLFSSDRHEKADEILSEAVERFPHRWVFPFYAGFNAWQGLGQMDRAAKLFFQAAQHGDSPRMLSGVASRLMTAHDRIDQTILLIEAALSQPKPPVIYERLVQELQDLRIERDLRALESAHADFLEQVGRPPVHLDELLGKRRDLRATALRIEARYDVADQSFSSPHLARRVTLSELSDAPSPDSPEGDE